MKISIVVNVDTSNPSELRELATRFRKAADELDSAAKSLEVLQQNPAYSALIGKTQVTNAKIDPTIVRRMLANAKTRKSVREAARLFLAAQEGREANIDAIFQGVNAVGASVANIANLSSILSRENAFVNVEKGRWRLAADVKAEPVASIEVGVEEIVPFDV